MVRSDAALGRRLLRGEVYYRSARPPKLDLVLGDGSFFMFCETVCVVGVVAASKSCCCMQVYLELHVVFVF